MTQVPWNRAIIVGASSGIGEAIASQLAASGCRIALVARREAELKSIANRINANAGDVVASVYPHDVTDVNAVPDLFRTITADLGGLDVIFYASGYMPRIAPDEFDTEKDVAIIDVNVTGAVAWLNESAHRFSQARTGTIVGIGSVAGDRGRRGNPVYGASKAFLDHYLESLRNRLAVKGVSVVTIKPGPVDTPMTQGLGKLPGMISADEAAQQIITAAKEGTRIAYIPAKWKVIMGVIKAIPSPVFQFLNV
jgi:short-subunit dehydrogenase